MIAFSPVPQDVIRDILVNEGFLEADARCASQISPGVEKARQLCQLEWFAELRALVIELNQEILEKGSIALFQMQKRLLQDPVFKDEVKLFLELLLIWLKDIWLYQLGEVQRINNCDALAPLKKQAQKMTRERTMQSLLYVLETIKRMDSHANPQLAIERMILSIQEG
jgi:DNA polymerase-3 subunit delta'